MEQLGCFVFWIKTTIIIGFIVGVFAFLKYIFSNDETPIETEMVTITSDKPIDPVVTIVKNGSNIDTTYTYTIK
jgi:hypothetical protein